MEPQARAGRSPVGWLRVDWLQVDQWLVCLSRRCPALIATDWTGLLPADLALVWRALVLQVLVLQALVWRASIAMDLADSAPLRLMRFGPLPEPARRQTSRPPPQARSAWPPSASLFASPEIRLSVLVQTSPLPLSATYTPPSRSTQMPACSGPGIISDLISCPDRGHCAVVHRADDPARCR